MKSQELVRVRVPARDARRREVLGAVQARYDTLAANDSAPAPRWCAPQLLAESRLRRSDPDLRAIFDLPVPSEQRLKALFDLTAAEARIAQRLACGDSVEEAARKLSIKITTARTQLASIFAKTETRRQAKLVAVLSRVAHLG